MKSKYDIFTKKELTDFLDGYEKSFNNIFWDTPMEVMLDKKMDELLKQMRALRPSGKESLGVLKAKLRRWERLNNEYEKFFELRFGKKLGGSAK